MLCLCLSAAKFQTLCFFLFCIEGGTLPSQGIPNVVLHDLLPNTLAPVLYLSRCQAIYGTSLAQTLFSRANWPSLATRQQWRSNGPVLKEWGGSSAWSLTVPLELCVPCDKVAWWVGNRCLPAAGLARGAGEVPVWQKNCSVQNKNTHTHNRMYCIQPDRPWTHNSNGTEDGVLT